MCESSYRVGSSRGYRVGFYAVRDSARDVRFGLSGRVESGYRVGFYAVGDLRSVCVCVCVLCVAAAAAAAGFDFVFFASFFFGFLLSACVCINGSLQ